MWTSCGFGQPMGDLAKGAYGAGSHMTTGGVKAIRQHAEPGDWHCPQCNDLQFARVYFCRRCKAGKPKDPKYFPRGGMDCAVSGGHTGKAAGDWICKGCGNMVHSARNVCHYCTAPKPTDIKVDANAESSLKQLQGGAPLAIGYIAPTAKLHSSCTAWSDQWGTALTSSSIVLKPVVPLAPYEKPTDAKPSSSGQADRKRDKSSESEGTKKEKAAKRQKKAEKKDKDDTKKQEAATKEEEKRRQMKERRANRDLVAIAVTKPTTGTTTVPAVAVTQPPKKMTLVVDAGAIAVDAGAIALDDDDEVVLDD